MKKSQTFLAYYSILVSNSLILWSFLVASKPQGFVLALAVLPISIYFWVLVSGNMPHNSPDQTDTSSFTKSPLGLFLTLAFTVSTASVLFYISLTGSLPKKELSDLSSTLHTLQKDVGTLKKSVETLKTIDKNLTSVDIRLRHMQDKEDTASKLDMMSVLPSATPEATIRPSQPPITNTEP